MTGIVLAGGKSSRMGQNKALMLWQGQPLIQRSLEVLRLVFSEIIISSNTPELYREFGEKVVPDRFQDCGPLGGLHACLQVSRFDFSFFVACDMPFLDPEVIRFLAAFTEGYSVVIPDVAGGLHPLHAFYHKNCLPIIEKNLEAKCFKILEIYKECPVRYVYEEEFYGFPQIKRVFANINTPQEWKELQSL